MTRRGYPAAPHDRLGYVAEPGAHSEDNHWGTVVTIDEDGFRSNGQIRPEGEPILVVGDSFTFGDQVDDRESWPAALERTLERPVYNAGVFGYAFDQSILRAEAELPRVRPSLLVVSLIADDLWRNELSRRYAEKPYFDLSEDGGLTLRNVPIPERRPSGDPFWKDIIGMSALADAIISKSKWKDWYFASDRDVRIHPRGTGLEIGKRLIARIQDRCRESNCELLLMLQGPRHDHGSEHLVTHARALGVLTLDLVERLETEERDDPTIRERLFDGHMTEMGNQWVADHIQRTIR